MFQQEQLQEPYKCQTEYLQLVRKLIINHNWNLHGGGKTYYWLENNFNREYVEKEKTVPGHIYKIIKKIDQMVKLENEQKEKNLPLSIRTFNNAIAYIESKIQNVLKDHNKRKHNLLYRIFGRSQDTVDFYKALDMPYDIFLLIEKQSESFLRDTFIDNLALAQNQAKGVNGHTFYVHPGQGAKGYPVSNTPRHVSNIRDKIVEAQQLKITYYQAVQKVQKILENSKIKDNKVNKDNKSNNHWWALRHPRVNNLYRHWLAGCSNFLNIIGQVKKNIDDQKPKEKQEKGKEKEVAIQKEELEINGHASSASYIKVEDIISFKTNIKSDEFKEEIIIKLNDIKKQTQMALNELRNKAKEESKLLSTPKKL